MVGGTQIRPAEWPRRGQKVARLVAFCISVPLRERLVGRMQYAPTRAHKNASRFKRPSKVEVQNAPRFGVPSKVEVQNAPRFGVPSKMEV